MDGGRSNTKKRTLASVLLKRERLDLSIADLGKALRCSRATAYRWVQDGDPKPETLALELLQYLEERTRSTGEFVSSRAPWGRALRDAPDFRAWLEMLCAPVRVENPALRRRRGFKSVAPAKAARAAKAKKAARKNPRRAGGVLVRVAV